MIQNGNSEEVDSIEINGIKCFKKENDAQCQIFLTDHVIRSLTIDLFGKREVNVTYNYDFNREMG